MSYVLLPKQHARSTFEIYPQQGCWDDDANLINKLGEVRARSAKEAARLASERGIGQGQAIWVTELVEDARLIAINVMEKHIDKSLGGSII